MFLLVLKLIFEISDLEREQRELIETPDEELQELAQIYENRGLRVDTAMEVAVQLTAHNALEAHARDELGIMEMTEAQPLQAAVSSGLAFTIGGFLPVLVAFVAPLQFMEYIEYGFVIVFLAILGMVSARAGGSRKLKAVVRITFWGTLAMGITALIGHIFNSNIA